MKTRFIKTASLLVIVLGCIAFYLYQNGHIGLKTLTEEKSEVFVNPYDGIYTYEKSRITNDKILKSINLAEENGYTTLKLSINNTGATLLGYQLASRVRNRFFTVCVSDDSIMLYNGKLGTANSDHCKVPEGNEFQLKLIPISEDVLFCEECEKEDFPKYWKKLKN